MCWGKHSANVFSAKWYALSFRKMPQSNYRQNENESNIMQVEHIEQNLRYNITLKYDVFCKCNTTLVIYV